MSPEQSSENYDGQWMCADSDVFPSREEAVDHLRLVGEPGEQGRLRQLPESDDRPWETVAL